MKRSLACGVTIFLVFLCLIMCFSACSASEVQDPGYEKHQLLHFSTEPTLYEVINFKKWEFSSLAPVSDTWQEFLDSIFQSQVEFMNSTYGAGWTYGHVEAYGVDLSESGLDFSIGGAYDPLHHRVYLDKNMLASHPSDATTKELAYIAHEVHHFAKAHNSGSAIFVIQRNNRAMGNAFSEAMANVAAIKWLTATGNEKAANHLRNGGYASTTLLCEQLELAIPDLFLYYASDNIKGLEKAFNTACKLHISEPEDSLFEYWIYNMERIYEIEHTFYASKDPLDMVASKMYLIGNVELLAAITHKDNYKSFWTPFWEYDNHYGELFFSSLPPETFDPIRALFYVEPEPSPSIKE